VQVTRDKAREITEEVVEEVRKVLAKHGLKLDKYNTTYGESWAIKISGHKEVVNAETGVDEGSAYARDFLRFPMQWGLTEKALGCTVKVRGVDHTFVGTASRRPKYPFALRNNRTGKLMMHTESVVPYFPEDVKA